MLEREIEQFSIVEREGLIIACAALYPIADSEAGELACLAVNLSTATAGVATNCWSGSKSARADSA